MRQQLRPLPDTEGYMHRNVSQIPYSQDKSRITGKAVELTKTGYNSHKQK